MMLLLTFGLATVRESHRSLTPQKYQLESGHTLRVCLSTRSPHGTLYAQPAHLLMVAAFRLTVAAHLGAVHSLASGLTV